MATEPLTLSVVIPAYNEEHHIENCLEAFAHQTETPDEVIVVNNNSTDATVRLAQRYHFVTVINESQQGIVFARNAGFDHATGDVLARIDADTIVAPDWVATVKKLAGTMSPNDAATGPCTFRGSLFPMVAYGFHRVIYFWSGRAILGHHTLFGSNMFLFRSKWQSVRSQVCLTNKVHEDMDLSSHIAADRGRIHFFTIMHASISNRRFHNWSHYPSMWCYSLAVHLPPLRFFKTR